jgi:predicted dienelactone hydrolase
VLALAGGVPTTGFEKDTFGEELALEVEHDPRLRAVVLFAPATAWFRKPGALAEVSAPVLMLLGEKDTDANPGFHGAIVINGLPPATPLRYRTVPNANHFAFQSVFPEAMRRPGFRPAMDEEGFDRPLFLQALYPEVLAFLTEARHTK